MREIKFRVWDKESKYLIEGDIIRDCIIGKFIDNPEREVMQYTGLKDKNGKEIYEGDIIFIYDDEETESGWWENVFYHQGAFMAGDEDLLCNVHFRSKVIGNKYEKLQP